MLFLIYKFRRKIKHFILIAFSILLTILYLSTVFNKTESFKESKALITNVSETDYSYQITAKIKNKQYNFYYYEELTVGAKYHLSGIVNEYDQVKVPNGFNAYRYYKSNNIHGFLTNVKVTEVKHLKSIDYYIYSLRLNLTKYLSPTTKGYLESIIFNTKNNEDETKELLSSLNIMHLISLSGMHIFLVLVVVRKIFFRLDIEIIKQELLECVIVAIFYLFTSYKYIILRILIYKIIKLIKNRYELPFNNYTLMHISFLILIIIKPFLMINTGILISFIIINTLSLLKPLYEDKSTIYKSVITSGLIALVLLPFNNKLNIISIVLMPLFILMFTYVLFPLGLITIMFNSFEVYFKTIYDLVFKVLTFVDTNLNVLTITFGKMHLISVVMYFILLIMMLYLKSYLKIIINSLLLIIVLMIPAITRKLSTESLYFLDVGQGDSFVYINKDLVIVVDAYNSVENFLTSKNIITIDYLILSHSDSDHSLEANNLINTFNVRNLILSRYDNYDLNHTNITLGRAGLVIKEAGVTLDFFGPLKPYDNKNDNSLVFKLTTINQSVLFTGDIELSAEYDLANKYKDLLKSDILKVSHHGSNTSSSQIFLNYVDPKYAIISVGRNNKFNFPDNSVINRLSNSGIKIYRTDELNTITITTNKLHKIECLIMKKHLIIV